VPVHRPRCVKKEIIRESECKCNVNVPQCRSDIPYQPSTGSSKPAKAGFARSSQAQRCSECQLARRQIGIELSMHPRQNAATPPLRPDNLPDAGLPQLHPVRTLPPQKKPFSAPSNNAAKTSNTLCINKLTDAKKTRFEKIDRQRGKLSELAATDWHRFQITHFSMWEKKRSRHRPAMQTVPEDWTTDEANAPAASSNHTQQVSLDKQTSTLPVRFMAKVQLSD